MIATTIELRTLYTLWPVAFWFLCPNHHRNKHFRIFDSRHTQSLASASPLEYNLLTSIFIIRGACVRQEPAYFLCMGRAIVGAPYSVSILARVTFRHRITFCDPKRKKKSPKQERKRKKKEKTPTTSRKANPPNPSSSLLPSLFRLHPPLRFP